MEFNFTGEVLTIESNTFKGKTYKKALIVVDGKSFIIGLKSGTTLTKGKQPLTIELSTFGSDLKPNIRLVGEEDDEVVED